MFSSDIIASNVCFGHALLVTVLANLLGLKILFYGTEYGEGCRKTAGWNDRKGDGLLESSF